MTDAAARASGTVSCWNCHQPLQAGADRCIWCGVAQTSAAAALITAPAGYVAGGAPLTGGGSVAGVTMPAPQGMLGQSAAPPVAVAVPPMRLAPPVNIGLGPEFRGTLAATAPRVLAFSIDVVLVAVVATAVLLLTGSPAFATLTVVELAIGFWVMQARTGATVGQLLLRLRTSRPDGPISPGALSSLVRFMITGAGFAVLGAGAWLVVASGQWDPARRRRSLTDRASRTIVVAAPPRSAPSTSSPIAAPGPAQTSRRAGQPPILAPGGMLQPPAPLATAIQPDLVQPTVPIIPATSAVLPPPASVQPPPPPAQSLQPQNLQPHDPRPQESPEPQAFAPTPAVLADPQVISTRRPSTPIDDESASAQSPAATPEEPLFETVAVQRPSAPTGDALLIIFDTGQREQIALPAAVNLGRNPVASQEGDALISVLDPDSTVSKTHARVEHIDGETWISDGGSTNGTEVISDEGVVTVLAPRVRTLLEDGARIRIGKRAFTVSVLQGGTS